MACYISNLILTKTNKNDVCSVSRFIMSIPWGSVARIEKNIFLKDTNKGEI